MCPPVGRVCAAHDRGPYAGCPRPWVTVGPSGTGPRQTGAVTARVGVRVRPAPWVAAVVLAWIPPGLLLDRHATLSFQVVLGLGTWALLLAVLRTQDRVVQAQTAVVVVFATVVEYTFSAVLHVYVY